MELKLAVVSSAPMCACRHYHPAPPARTVKQERSFEGISLETPGSSSKSVLQMSRFQLCQECYASAADAAAVVRTSIPSRPESCTPTCTSRPEYFALRHDFRL
jgi:hypothetical protein